MKRIGNLMKTIADCDNIMRAYCSARLGKTGKGEVRALYVTRATKDVAPKIHSLTRLAELSGLTISAGMRDVLGETGRFNIAGRYPDEKNQPVPIRSAQARVKRAKDVFRWLMMQL